MSLPANFSDNKDSSGGSFFSISLASAQEGFAIGTPSPSGKQINLYHLHQGQWQADQLPFPPDLAQDLANGPKLVKPNDITMVSPDEAWAFLGEIIPPTDQNNTVNPGYETTLIYHYVNGTWSVFER